MPVILLTELEVLFLLEGRAGKTGGGVPLVMKDVRPILVYVALIYIVENQIRSNEQSITQIAILIDMMI